MKVGSALSEPTIAPTSESCDDSRNLVLSRINDLRFQMEMQSKTLQCVFERRMIEMEDRLMSKLSETRSLGGVKSTGMRKGNQIHSPRIPKRAESSTNHSDANVMERSLLYWMGSEKSKSTPDMVEHRIVSEQGLENPTLSSFVRPGDDPFNRPDSVFEDSASIESFPSTTRLRPCSLDQQSKRSLVAIQEACYKPRRCAEARMGKPPARLWRIKLRSKRRIFPVDGPHRKISPPNPSKPSSTHASTVAPQTDIQSQSRTSSATDAKNHPLAPNITSTSEVSNFHVPPSRSALSSTNVAVMRAFMSQYQASYHTVYSRDGLRGKAPTCCGLLHRGSRAHAFLSGLLRGAFGIADPNVWRGDPGSRIVHPASIFAAGMEFTGAAFLVYSLAVVPVQLSLWNDIGPCQAVPTLKLDMAADLFFMSEILVRFFIGVEVNGEYCDDLPTVAHMYATSPNHLLFDAVTSIPFSWIDWSVLQECRTDGTLSRDDGGFLHNAGALRLLKVLRILKLSRLRRLLEFFRVVSEQLDLSPSRMRLWNLFLALVSVIHLCACAFWRVKLETNDSDTLMEWMDQYHLTPNDNGSIYTICCYFVCTVFFTVGFGDISATNLGERIFCMALMACGACVFGLILGELQEIYATANTRTRQLDDHMESVVTFLNQNRVPKGLERRVKNWIRFQYPQKRADIQGNNGNQNQEIMDTLPPVLRQTLASNMNRGLFSKVVLWSRIPNSGSLKDHFTSELLLRMHTCFYLARSAVATHREKGDRLMIIVSGNVSLYEPGKIDAAHRLFSIGPGGSIGDNTILGDTRWAGIFGIDADYIAEDNCKICFFYTKDILDVIRGSPRYLMVRKLVHALQYDPSSDDVHESDPAAPSGASFRGSSILEAQSEGANSDNPGACDADKNSQNMRCDLKGWARQAWQECSPRCVLHWIRISRMLLHSDIGSPTLELEDCNGKDLPDGNRGTVAAVLQALVPSQLFRRRSSEI